MLPGILIIPRLQKLFGYSKPSYNTGITKALADEGHGCAAELCSNAATQGAWLSAETNQFTLATALYLCLCLLWMSRFYCPLVLLRGSNRLSASFLALINQLAQ